MKLILCTECQDVVKINNVLKRYCTCEKSWCYLSDGNLHAVISGPCVPIGLADRSVAATVRLHLLGENDGDWGVSIEAFAIPENAPTIHREL